LITETVHAQEKISENQSLLIDIFKELIEINTTGSDGNTTIAAQAMAKRLTDAGLSETDIHVLSRDPAKGNLVVRYKGKGHKKPILLLAHIDVVSTKKEEWSFDPFQLTESEGYYYGRGTIDDKAMAAIFIANLISYQKEGFLPERDIIVCLTSDEEVAGPNGIQWLLKEHRDLVDAEFCINEGGSGQIIDGDYKLNEIQIAEKIYQSYRLVAKTKGGHSSLPTKDNSIYELSESLVRLSKYEFPVQLNESTRSYFKVMSTINEGQLSADMKAILSPSPDKEAINRLSEIPYYNALLRTTCVATMFNAGHAENALPQTATAIVNCRILPDTPIDDVDSTLKNIVANENIEITPIWEDIEGEPSPLSPMIMEKVTKVTNEIWPGVAVIPTMATSATDGLFMRNAGIPTYGISGIFEDINDNRAHGKDERIAKKVLFESQEFLYKLIKELSISN
jgi:acetylornithine deacetylase/succinyl-diaminopimelate desuccinylase-like protein